MSSKAQKYFDKRALEDAVRSINLSEDFIEQKLKKYYKKASKEVQEYIKQFYEKFANQEDITLAEAKRMIKKAEFKNIDFEALSKYAIVAEDKQLSTYVNALSKKGQITRLELLNLEINKTLSKLFDEEQVSVYELLADTYEDKYFRSIYNVQSYFQTGVDFIKPNEDVIRNAVTQSWSKSNYSQRIWGHKKQLAENLREHITTGLIQGNSVDKMASKMSKDMDVSLSNAKRLVRTETNYVHNKATLDSYKEYADIEQYKYLATLDNRTSKQCQELDCKIFYTKDVEVGKNYPPMHPNCRSTTVVYFKEDPVGSRIARGADGKTYYVPADTSYKEWWNNLSEDDKGKMRVDLKERYRHNQDKEQLKKYKRVLGKNAPSTIAKFQEMKYNNTKEWEELKARYRGKNKGLSANKATDDNTPKHDKPKLLEKLDVMEDSIISAKLKEYEKVIVKDDEKENAIVITKDGEVWQCFGVIDRVFPDVDLEDKLYGAYVTHNHPISKTNGSFSDVDIDLFLNYDLKVLRGCDSMYEYKFTRTLDTIKEDRETIIHKFRADYFYESLQRTFDKEITIGLYDEFHYINEVFAEYNKFIYERNEY